MTLFATKSYQFLPVFGRVWGVWKTTLPCLLSFNSGPCAHSLSKKTKNLKRSHLLVTFDGNQISYQTRKTSCVVVPQGFEPQPTEPKSVVLPLHQGTSHHPHGVCRRSSVDSNNQMSWRWRDSNPYREPYGYFATTSTTSFSIYPLELVNSHHWWCIVERTYAGKRLRPGNNHFFECKKCTHIGIDNMFSQHVMGD